MNFEKLLDEICNLKEEFIGQKEQIAKLTEENRALKEQLAKMKKMIPRRPMPSELVDEMFACLPLENAFGILTGMPNGLLARNVRKMLKSIKMAMNANKWNAANCGPNLSISEGGMVAKYKYSGYPANWNSVRAVLPIPKFNLNIKSIIYFEVEFLIKNYPYDISIGFCTKHFPLEGYIDQENVENSIGILSKRGIRIGESYSQFENVADPYFNTGDVVGIGIVHSPANSPMKCFSTCNGKLLGMAELPAKFADLELWPMVRLRGRNSIRTNFGQNEWLFNPEQLRQSFFC